MNASHTLTSRLRYLADLARAGMDGANSAARTVNAPAALISPVWAPAAVGAVVGASTLSLNRSRRSGYAVAAGGLVGSVLGLGCGLAWASRGLARTVARGAIRKINAERDAHWIAMHPIDYA